MNLSQGFVARDEVSGTCDEVWDGLWQRWQFFEQAANQLLKGTRGQPPFLHLLRCGVVGLHAHARKLQRVGPVHVWVGDVDAVVEDCRLAKDYIFHTNLVSLFRIFATLEPHEIHDTGAIAEMGDDALFARSHLESLKTEDLTYNLNERHIACQFVDGIDLRAVDVLVREIVE